MRRIRLFIASSGALNEERAEIERWISRRNDQLSLEKEIYIQLVIWEKLSSSFTKTRKQDKFNEELLDSEIFVCLVDDQVGQFTYEEFRTARTNFLDDGNPRLILIYFKNTSTPGSPKDKLRSILDLKREITDGGQIWRDYTNVAELLLHLTSELDAYVAGLSPALSRESYSTLPRGTHFVGRKKELADIADALAYEARGFGIMIHGPGGIGKTSLAIRAALDASSQDFPIKVFLSAQVAEQGSEGKISLSEYALTDFDALISALAVQLGAEEIKHAPANSRANTVQHLLARKKALIIFDNVETFSQEESDRLFVFLNRLPNSCKAIVTSRRRRENIHAPDIRLDRLKRGDALKLMDELAELNRTLARATENERESLYEIAGGNPQLIKWVCGQLGRPESNVRTIADACALIGSPSQNNDPLEFIFGNLLDSFRPAEIAALSALTYFGEPAKVEWVADLAGLSHQVAQTALEDLYDRALLDTDETKQRFFLPTLTSTFLQRERPAIVEQTGDRLLNRTYALVNENGGKKYGRFSTLEDHWPEVAAALPVVQQSDNIKLQSFCDDISTFLNFTGRQDELLSLCQLAEKKASSAGAFNLAANRAYQVACIFHSRGQADALSACALRCEDHWLNHINQVNLGKPEGTLIGPGKQEQAMLARLKGLFHQMNGSYSAARVQLLKAQELHQSIGHRSKELVIVMNDLALLQAAIGERVDSELYLKNALILAKEAGYKEEILICLKNLAGIKLYASAWIDAEKLIREGLVGAQKLGWAQLVEEFAGRLSKALAREAIKDS